MYLCINGFNNKILSFKYFDQIYNNSLTCLHKYMYKVYLLSSPYTYALKVVLLTFNLPFKNLKWIQAFYFLGFRQSQYFTCIR